MPFEVRVISNTPLVGETDIRDAVKLFMTQIGYISHGSENNTALALFLDCFLLHPDRAWTAEELMAEINTSRPTLYRHLNRLKYLDILEEMSVPNPKETSSKPKKGYKLKYGNFAKAWTFTDAHIRVALENYISSVAHIQKLLEEQKK